MFCNTASMAFMPPATAITYINSSRTMALALDRALRHAVHLHSRLVAHSGMPCIYTHARLRLRQAVSASTLSASAHTSAAGSRRHETFESGHWQGAWGKCMCKRESKDGRMGRWQSQVESVNNTMCAHGCDVQVGPHTSAMLRHSPRKQEQDKHV